jgi:hypothetical protein
MNKGRGKLQEDDEHGKLGKGMEDNVNVKEKEDRGNAHGCKALDRGKEEAFEGEINFKREINDNEPLEDYALASTDRLAMSQLLPMTINNSNMDKEVEVYNCRSSD